MTEAMKGTKANANMLADLAVIDADGKANPAPSDNSCADTKKARDRLSPKMKGDLLPKLFNCATIACGCEKSGVI